jgi:hypothetical protein
MVTEEGVKGYSLVEFITIQPKTGFSTRNSFADENGNPVSDAFSLVKNAFREGGEKTTVYIEKQFEDLATLEMIVSMGYEEGTAIGFSALDEYLRTLVGSK